MLGLIIVNATPNGYGVYTSGNQAKSKAIFNDVLRTHRDSFEASKLNKRSYVKELNRIRLNHVNIISITDGYVLFEYQEQGSVRYLSKSISLMKNLTILVLFFSLCVSAYSQKKKDPSEKESLFRWGFKGGLNLNKIQGESFKNEFSYNYALGGFMQINFSRKLGIQPEINFAQTSAEQSDDITVIYDDLFLGGTQKKAKLDYLKFAGLLNVDVGPSQRVKLQLGPQWGILLNEAVDSLKTPGDIFKNGEFSVLGGIMLQLPLFHLGTRYEIGLTDINGIDNQDKWTSQAWQFFVGITL